MFIELTAYGFKRLINTDYIQQVFKETGSGIVKEEKTRLVLNNTVIDVAESYEEITRILKESDE